MDSQRPGTYIPFSRWFTNEKKRELEEVSELYAWVEGKQAWLRANHRDIARKALTTISDLEDDLFQALYKAMFALLVEEEYLVEVPPPTFEKMSLQEFVEYRNRLVRKQYYFQNQDFILDLMDEGLASALGDIANALPRSRSPSPFTIPLVYTLPEPGRLIQRIFMTLADDEYIDRGLFKPVTERLYENLARASGRDPKDQKSTKPWKHAGESSLVLSELVDMYLSGTPFHELFMMPVPLKLTHEDRFNHMHIVGGTGAGKTSLIENLIIHDLISPDPPSLVLVDPHGDLIRKLTRANLGIQDRLIIIDPRDIHNPPALNVFALNNRRINSYDEATREQGTAGVIQTFDYLFSGLVGADLTAKQGVFFRYVARLMLSMPDTMGRNATIVDMLRLMSDATPYMPAINALSEIPKEFFLRDFNSKTFVQTKEQIRYRLQAIIENPTMARLFTSPETKVDLFAEMNRGAIILVDTAKDYLKGASDNFGRFFISLVLQAVLERAAIPANRRKDTFLIIDEAASYFDSNIDDLLTEARKYKCGLVLAHQYLDQATGSLRASLAANTGTKFASGLSAADARAMATDMRTTPDFILSQPKLQFAAHIRNVTPQAVSIPIRAGSLAGAPKLSAEAFAGIMEANRRKVSLPPEARRPPPPPPAPEPQPRAQERPAVPTPPPEPPKPSPAPKAPHVTTIPKEAVVKKEIEMEPVETATPSAASPPPPTPKRPKPQSPQPLDDDISTEW